MENKTILDVIWFSISNDIIGIVKLQDEITKEIKFYLGKGTGINEKHDIESIITMGAKVYPEMLINFFK